MKKKKKSQFFLQNTARWRDLTGNKKDTKENKSYNCNTLKRLSCSSAPSTMTLLFVTSWPTWLSNQRKSVGKKKEMPTAEYLWGLRLLCRCSMSSRLHLLKLEDFFFHSNNLFYTTKIWSSQNSLEQNVVSYLKMNMWIWIIIIGHILNSTTAPKLYLFVKGSLLIRYRDKVKSVRANVFNDNLFKSNLIGIHSSWFRPSPGTSSNFCPQNQFKLK